MLLNVQNAMIRQNNRTPDFAVGSSLLVVEYLTSDIKHQTSDIKRQTSNIIHQIPRLALIAGTRASASAVQRS